MIRYVDLNDLDHTLPLDTVACLISVDINSHKNLKETQQ